MHSLQLLAEHSIVAEDHEPLRSSGDLVGFFARVFFAEAAFAFASRAAPAFGVAFAARGLEGALRTGFVLAGVGVSMSIALCQCS